MFFLIYCFFFNMCLCLNVRFSVCSCHMRFWSHECEYVYLYCTSAEPADCSTSSQVMWNVSGTEHRMCSSSPQRAVWAHSLPLSLIYMLAHSFLFPPSLPLCPRPCLRHCTATHDIMGLLLCLFVWVWLQHIQPWYRTCLFWDIMIKSLLYTPEWVR